MNIPINLKYSDTDEWIFIEGKVATIGITDYAQSQLSDIVYVEFKVDVGENIKINSACVTLEVCEGSRRCEFTSIRQSSWSKRGPVPIHGNDK